MSDVNADVQVASDFVYQGKRRNREGKVFATVQLLDAEGKLTGEAMLYAYNKKLDKNVGAIYTGATFDSKGSARGIAEARFVKLWPVQGERIEWQAKDEQVEVELRNEKLEKDTGRISELEQILLPLRKQYESYRFRHDWAGQEALEKAMLRALRSAPRVIEK